MIRPITCLCVIAAAASGLYLYQTKHTTHMLDRQIEQTMQAANAVREHSQMLRAEWANLNDTTRLADLAARHLTLRQVMPVQFVNLVDLDRHLPATRSFAAPDAAPDLAPAPADVPMAQAAPAARQAAPAPAVASSPAMPTTQTASAASAPGIARPAAPQTARLAAAALPAATPLLPAAVKPSLRAAAADPGEVVEHEARAREAASHESGTREPGGRETAPAIRPVITQAMATSLPRPTARVAYEPAQPAAACLGRPVPFDGAVPAVTSALGNARTALAPPVPVAVSATGLAPR